MTNTIRVLNTFQKELYSIYLENYFKLRKWWCVQIQPKLDFYLERLQYFHRDYDKGNNFIRFVSFYTLLNVEDFIKILKQAIEKLKDYNTVARINVFLQVI